MADNSKLRVLDEDNVFFTIMIDGEALQVDFLNDLYSFDLGYNLLSVGITEEAGYLVLAKNRRTTVFDNGKNVILVETQIRTGYLVDVLCNKVYQVYSSSLSLQQNHTS